MNTSPEHQRPPSKRSRHRHRLRFDGGSGVSNSRHRILREVIRELRRQPFVTAVRGHPPSTFTEVRAEVAPERWGLDVETATLRVTWIPLDPPEFTIHYSDETFDCAGTTNRTPMSKDWLTIKSALETAHISTSRRRLTARQRRNWSGSFSNGLTIGSRNERTTPHESVDYSRDSDQDGREPYL